jgi:hypothetical protein
MTKQDQLPSLKETVAAAFGLAKDAKRLRDSIEKQLPTIAPGRVHGTAHRLYVVLNDFALGSDALEGLAEMHALNR